MEAKLSMQGISPLPALYGRRRILKPKCSPIFAVLTRPADKVAEAIDNRNAKPADLKTRSLAQRTSVYHDNWFDLMAINHLSKSIQDSTGLRSLKRGYDSLVEAAAMVSRNFNPNQQREVVVHALERAFPRLILSMVRMLLPQSKLGREYCAAFTTVFFAWLVGPCEVRESELDGRMEKNVVHIKKCRFLEQTNCVGMCTNLCKIPSQAFIKDSLGMPVNMVPDFDDMSCEMIFGLEPPAPTDDPAFKQPCYELCKAKQKHSTRCPN